MILDEEKRIKVSIIIPVYNVSQYIRRCLDSCVNQTMEEIEIIAVNDCSPDPLDTEIMLEYEARYPQKIRCIWHSENKKQGGARNTGIAAARGEYLNFVDSDDYIEADMCEKLYTTAKENEADYVYCDYYEVRGANKKIIHRYCELDAENKRALHPYCVAWGSVIKRELFFKNNLKFAECMLYCEDVPMVYLLLRLANKIVKFHEALYNYCIREGSAIQSSTIYDRMPWIFEAFNQTRELCKTVLNAADMFVWDTNAIVWLFDCLFLILYGCDDENSMAMYKEYVCKNNIDMDMVISSIKNNYKRGKIQILWNLLHQQMEGKQLQAAMSDYDVSYIAKRIKQLGFEDKRITVWGSGKRGLQMGEYLQCAGIPFSVVDVNTNRHGLILLDDIPIEAWENRKDSTDVVIATPKLCFHEIREQISSAITVIDMEELLK